ncbi:MAG: DNA primase [Flavobacteriales bacterium]|nr:DNA primase [Flavobacteriales bacterium]
MIPKETIEKIFEVANIVDVVGDFVVLKKAGSSYKGLSPFVNEKSPSFMVSPAKGIFKDFSSGKGGNVVSFIMEHEHFTYVEALRWLANKYGIEIEEKEQTSEEIAAQSERESLFIINGFAKEYFEEQLHETQEGKAVGLSYFRERGFSLETIKKFGLGYSPDRSDALTKAALDKGYKLEFLEKTGLSKTNEKGSFDFFRGRVIFPIQNITGRVLGFGARTLKNDKKIAKYFNSPESEIYNKSKILYGLFQSKNEIIKNDECFLVEGYTDVISLHQAGVYNVVASSGTALTEGQIRLVKRYTNNITILYDGDAAGIKASFRGIDLILEQGLNVKVVLFPDGDDPDSYSRKMSQTELLEYIKGHQQDFIHFKAGILLKDTENDPIKRADTIKDIVKSIGVIPDQITRSVYIRETSHLFEIAEQALHNEVNKLLRAGQKKEATSAVDQAEEFINDVPEVLQKKQDDKGKHALEIQERDLVRLMVQYGAQEIPVKVKNESNEEEEVAYFLSQYIVEELLSDELQVTNPAYQRIFDEFLEGLEKGLVVSDKHFIQHHDASLSQIVIDISTPKDVVSDNWEKKHKILPTLEIHKVKEAAQQSVAMYKLRVLENMIIDSQEKLKVSMENNQLDSLLMKIRDLTDTRNIFANKLGIVITR